MALEDLKGEALEGGCRGGDLREDVDAVALVVYHPLDAAHLALDPVEALHERLLVRHISVRLAHGLTSLGLEKRRSRRPFVPTNTLEKAIAPAATIGLRSPATPSGMAATLYAKAQNRCVLIVARTRRASRIASGAARRSPDTSVRSPASMATSVPVPMAMPRSACASAGASLIPSPTTATTSPASWRRRTSAAFPAGSTAASTRSIPTSAATRRAVLSSSPVS